MAKKQANAKATPPPTATQPSAQTGVGPSTEDVAIAEKIRKAAGKDPIIGAILAILFGQGPLMLAKLAEEVQRRIIADPGDILSSISDAVGFGYIKISDGPLKVCRLTTVASVGMTVIHDFSNPA